MADPVKTAEINKTLREVSDLNEKLSKYKASFEVLVCHSESHFTIAVPEEFAHELNLKYEINYLTNDPKVFYLAKARKFGVRPGKKHTNKRTGADFRLLQFASFPQDKGAPQHFGRTPARLWMKDTGDCEIEVQGEFAETRHVNRGPNSKPTVRTPNPDPIPIGIPPEVLDKVDEAVIADLKKTTTGKSKKSPLRKHLDSASKVLPATDPVGINKETVRLAVVTINQYMRENRNAELVLTEVDAEYHEPSDTESVQKLKLEITEIFE